MVLDPDGNPIVLTGTVVNGVTQYSLAKYGAPGGGLKWRKPTTPDAAFLSAHSTGITVATPQAQLLRYDATGKLLWTRNVAGITRSLQDLAQGPGGGFVFGGVFAVDEPYWHEEKWLAKCDSTARLTWHRIVGRSDYWPPTLEGLTIGASDRIAALWGANGLMYSAVRYAADGRPLWAAQYEYAEFGLDIAVDGRGGIATTLDAVNNYPGAGRLIRHDSAGTYMWDYLFWPRDPSDGYDHSVMPSEVVIDSADAVYVAGQTNTPLQGEPATATIDGSDIWLAKLINYGFVVWQRRLEKPGGQDVYELRRDVRNNLFLLGRDGASLFLSRMRPEPPAAAAVGEER
jgi:hypothetical protein